MTDPRRQPSARSATGRARRPLGWLPWLLAALLALVIAIVVLVIVNDDDDEDLDPAGSDASAHVVALAAA